MGDQTQWIEAIRLKEQVGYQDFLEFWYVCPNEKPVPLDYPFHANVYYENGKLFYRIKLLAYLYHGREGASGSGTYLDGKYWNCIYFNFPSKIAIDNFNSILEAEKIPIYKIEIKA